MVILLNATFNNIVVISWQSVLLVEEAGAPGYNQRPVANHWQILSSDILYRVCLTMSGIWTHNFTDWIGSCKSNYHAITTTTAPKISLLFLNDYMKTTVLSISLLFLVHLETGKILIWLGRIQMFYVK